MAKTKVKQMGGMTIEVWLKFEITKGLVDEN